jgi:hypothetical protein
MTGNPARTGNSMAAGREKKESHPETGYRKDVVKRIFFSVYRSSLVSRYRTLLSIFPAEATRAFFVSRMINNTAREDQESQIFHSNAGMSELNVESIEMPGTLSGKNNRYGGCLPTDIHGG